MLAWDSTVVALLHCNMSQGNRVSAIRTHLLVMILAESSPAEERIPLAKIQTATVETADLGTIIWDNVFSVVHTIHISRCSIVRKEGEIVGYV